MSFLIFVIQSNRKIPIFAEYFMLISIIAYYGLKRREKICSIFLSFVGVLWKLHYKSHKNAKCSKKDPDFSIIIFFDRDQVLI